MEDKEMRKELNRRGRGRGWLNPKIANSSDDDYSDDDNSKPQKESDQENVQETLPQFLTNRGRGHGYRKSGLILQPAGLRSLETKSANLETPGGRVIGRGRARIVERLQEKAEEEWEKLLRIPYVPQGSFSIAEQKERGRGRARHGGLPRYL